MKRCSRCRQTKPLEEFNKLRREKDGLQPNCRSCQSVMFAKWHAKTDTPERRKAKVVATADWRKRNPDKKRSNDIKREAAKKTNGWIEKVDRLVVYEREAYVCWICEEPTEPDAQQWNRRPSLDHVIALMDGGDHTYANLRCAHRRCNTLRGIRRYWERRRAGLPDMPTPDPAARLAPLKVQPEPKDPLRRKAGWTHCRNGHLMDEANTIIVTYKSSTSRRRCRICQNLKQKAQYAARREDPEFRKANTRRAQANYWRKKALTEQEPP